MLSWEQLHCHARETLPTGWKGRGVESGEEIEPHLSRQISIESVRCSSMCVTYRVCMYVCVCMACVCNQVVSWSSLVSTLWLILPNGWMMTFSTWTPKGSGALWMGLIRMIVQISVGNFYIESLNGLISGWLKILFGNAFDRIEKVTSFFFLLHFNQGTIIPCW